MFLYPGLVDVFRFAVAVGAIKQDDFPLVCGFLKDGTQVFLGARGLRKDNRLFLATLVFGFSETSLQRRKQPLAF